MGDLCRQVVALCITPEINKIIHTSLMVMGIEFRHPGGRGGGWKLDGEQSSLSIVESSVFEYLYTYSVVLGLTGVDIFLVPMFILCFHTQNK